MPAGAPTAGLRHRWASAIAASRGGGGALHDDAFVDAWLRTRRAEAGLAAVLVPLHELEGWRREPGKGDLRHAGGRFFSVIGVRCRQRVGHLEHRWDQPILEQPETGILGILARVIEGVMHFCLQAKEEPGNLGRVQLSPTVQATYSNYTRAHGGGAPRFVEHFTPPRPERLIFARLQSEDGARFLHKSNRNLIVDAGDDLGDELPDGFIWLTLRQIAGLLRRDDLINACARSVLSSLIFPLPEDAVGAAPREACPAGIWDTLQWLDDRRSGIHLQATRIGLAELREWATDELGYFSRPDRRFFRIVGMRVAAAGREVHSWCQPIVENPAPGVIGLLVRETRHGPELLMQARPEAGNRSAVQLGPTVQLTRESFAPGADPGTRPLLEALLDPGRGRVVHESRQAEEGARFLHEHHLHRIVVVPDGADVPVGDDHRWVPASHVQLLVHLGEQVNSSARSVLACLL